MNPIPPKSDTPLSAFSQPSPTTSTSSISSSARQLRSELYQAAEKRMVSTRSHDATPAKILKDKIQKGPRNTGAKKGKRKAEDDETNEVGGQPTEKKRRASIPLRRNVAIRTKTSSNEGSKSTPQRAVSVVVPTRIDTTPKTQRSPDLSNGNQSDTAQQAPENPNVTEPVSSPSPPEPEAQDQAPIEDIGPHSAQPPSQSPNKRTKNLDQPTNNPQPTSPKSKATHTRFSSTSPAPSSSTTNNSQPQRPSPPLPTEPTSDANSDDENEAPDTVTATTSQTLARAQTLDEARAATQFQREQKRKRRERDHRLKAQAKGVKKDHKIKNQSPKESTPPIDDVISENAASNPSTKTPKSIPALLPEHILTDAPILAPLPPPPPSIKPPPNQKRKFPTLDAKPPKDIKKGNINIRVLEPSNSMLPPKASVKGKAIRERWLMGRGLERRVGDAGIGGKGGFVRR